MRHPAREPGPRTNPDPTDHSIEVLLRASLVTIRMLSVCLCVDPRDNVSRSLDHRNWVSHRLTPGETPSLDSGCTVSDEVAESNNMGSPRRKCDRGMSRSQSRIVSLSGDERPRTNSLADAPVGAVHKSRAGSCQSMSPR